MKKFVISLIAICATLFFVSCGGDSKSPEKVEGDTDTTDTEKEGDDKTDSDSGNSGEGDTTPAGDTDSDTPADTDNPDTPADTDNPDTPADTDNPDTPADTDDPDSDNPDNENPLYKKFVGRWAAEVILHSNSVALGIPAPSITTRYFIADFYVNEKGQLDMNKVDNKLCRTDNRTGEKNATSASNVLFNESKFNTVFFHWKPADIAGQEDTPYVEVAENGEEISFKLNKDWELRGARMDNPATENMIDKKSDPRIFDHDEDGKDAFTLGIKGKTSLSTGTMYYVQRLWHVFEGKMVAEDKIEGNVDWSDEQFLVDATNATLKAPKNTTTLKDKSIFQFRKVSDSMDCDTLVNQLDTVFDLVDPNAGDAVGVN